MRIDVNTFIGEYPWRRVEGGTAESILTAMEQNRIDVAWISSLNGAFWKDPAAHNETLYRLAEEHPSLRPVPTINPTLGNWVIELDDAKEIGAPAVRMDPHFYGIAPTDTIMTVTAEMVSESGLPMLTSVRLEDRRQRHPHDVAPELEPWMIRALLRGGDGTRLIVTHADRDFIEQVHWGSTPEESRRVLWDISWLWGPPMDDLAHLLATIGPERFCFGTGMPLRIPEASVAKLDLLDVGPEVRAGIDADNLTAFLGWSRRLRLA